MIMAAVRIADGLLIDNTKGPPEEIMVHRADTPLDQAKKLTYIDPDFGYKVHAEWTPSQSCKARPGPRR
jgi:hypothetical protein